MALTLNGKVSWFGGPHDPEAGNTTASGSPISAGGIAVYDQATLGGFWQVTFPNGRTAVLKQTDIGPAPFTGRVLDVAYSSLAAVGYTEANFPTDSTIHAHYLGKGPGLEAQAAGASTVPASSSSTTGGILAPVAAVVGSSAGFLFMLVLAAGLGFWALASREAKIAGVKV